MRNPNSHSIGYVLAAVLGALVGGVGVALATRAIPKILSYMTSGMMQNMMAQMRESGCDPAEMWKRMMAGFGEAQRKEM